MKSIIRAITLASVIFLCAFGVAAKTAAVDDFLHRILPFGNDAERFEWTVTAQPDSVAETFTVSCDCEKIFIDATSVSALTSGINYYLREQAGICLGWGNMAAKLPDSLTVMERETHTAAVPLRYYLNFCTHSYSMSFWDWERWEQEIDLMALRGVNMPLITEGFECVWQQMLRDAYGTVDPQAAGDFLTGPAYFAWFYMNNLTGHGGPLPDSWYAQQRELARKIFARLGELGIKPVVPGYAGMIPNDFATRSKNELPENAVGGTGLWCGFERPAFVSDTTLLRETAAAYYAAVDKIFGDVLDTPYFAIDPFHEGGAIPEGVDCRATMKSLWKSLTDYRDDAVCVVQHWQDNPKQFLTETVPGGRLVILDLHADSQGSVICGGNNRTENGTPHKWVYCMLNNFGGNSGLFGRAPSMAESLGKAIEGREASALAGIGTIPEGIENNPLLFDLVYDHVWLDRVPSLDEWTSRYLAGRYGIPEGSEEHSTAFDVWKTILGGIYNCPSAAQQGVTESVFLMRPSDRPASVSTWANSSWYWNSDSLLQAARAMLALSDRLGDNPNYLNDLTDIMEQAVADCAHRLLSDYADADTARKAAIEQDFLSLLDLQNTLTGTRASSRLGTWIEQARSLGTSDAQKDLYEKNARMLLTTWGDRFQADEGGLHDYANREWNGLLSHYYAPRWKKWFATAPAERDSIDWFAFEKEFVDGISVPYGTFSRQNHGNTIDAAQVCLATVEAIYNAGK